MLKRVGNQLRSRGSTMLQYPHTGLSRWNSLFELVGILLAPTLQYPQSDLSRWNTLVKVEVRHQRVVAVPSTGPLSLEHWLKLTEADAIICCSTLNRASLAGTYIRRPFGQDFDELQYPQPGLSRWNVGISAFFASFLKLQYPQSGLLC